MPIHNISTNKVYPIESAVMDGLCLKTHEMGISLYTKSSKVRSFFKVAKDTKDEEEFLSGSEKSIGFHLKRKTSWG